MSASQPLSHQPKAQAAYAKLMEMIAALEPDARLPSALALREQLGVSMETLNLALRELERQHRTYSVRGVGIFVASPRRIVTLCNPKFFYTRQVSPFWQLLIEALQSAARDLKENYSFAFMHPESYRGDALPNDVRDALAKREIQGVICIGMYSIELVADIESHGAAVMGFAGVGTRSVEMAISQIGRLGIEELIHRGCHRIGYWSPHDDDERNVREDELEERVDINVFLQWLRDARLSTHELLAHTHNFFPIAQNFSALTHTEQGYALARDIFGDWKNAPLESLPQGLIIPNDLMTLGVLEALKELQIVPGRDLHIASHANKDSPTLQAYANQVNLIEFDAHELAAALFHTLGLMMRGVALPHRTVVVAPHLRAPRNTESKLKPASKIFKKTR